MSEVNTNSSALLVLIIPVAFAAVWSCAGYAVALIGGWRRLAKRFHVQEEFTGHKWNLQSARMRFGANYNNVLTIGANQTGLYMVPFVLFRLGHPPLFIPWTEISNVRPVNILFFFKYVSMQLGREEQIPFAINTDLAAEIKAVAGESWPRENWELSAD